MFLNYHKLINMMKNLEGQDCINYYRVSTKKQGNGTSLADQKELCMNRCKEMKLNIVEEFEEMASAMKGGKRPKFNAMVQMFKEGKAKVLVAAFSDRITRNGTDGDTIKELVENYGVTVIIVYNNLIMQNPVDYTNYLMFDLDIAFSNYRVRLDQVRCRIGSLAKNKSGFRAAPAPYGYSNDCDDSICVVMQNRAEFVQKAFELYATGIYSTSELSEALFEKGYKYELQPDKIIPKQSLISMLKNIFYTGKYYVEDELIDGKHKAIISQELFEKVQNLLDTAPKTPRKHDLLYSKSLQCENCGSFLVGDVKAKTNGNRYVYYRCTNSNCKERSVAREIDLDTDIERYLKEIRLGLIPDEIVQEVLKDELFELKHKLDGYKRDVSRKNQAEMKLNESITAKQIEDEKYIEGKLTQIQEKYGDLEAKIYCTQKQIDMIREHCSDIFKQRFYDIYKDFDTQTKRTALNLLANSFKWTSNGLKMTFKSAFRKIRKR